ncbi:MAG: 2-amino-4-hydroxy-6-hydroxymethyldihydropteridine diphosphokinase [Chloroflexi bacterium]|nr:2-amino-4-hydroxy-6-hydroxymethyldihydropteridine diphosphokinase [Chloroflexota bacterium]
MPIAYLGLGSNIGDREDNINKALRLICQRVAVEKVSSLYESEPWGYHDQPDFLNAVCRTTTNLSPRELLALAKEIERSLGRKPRFRNAPRPIDIDILLYENMVIVEADLVIPHPRMVERAFVLVPLAEIAPEAVHPQEGKTVEELAAKVKDKDKVRLAGQSGAPPSTSCRSDSKVVIRPLAMKDYDDAWRLWHLCKVPVGATFDRAAVERLVQRNPELILVAELNGMVIGTVIGALQGSQGHIFNHAVDPRCRGRGIGTRLFQEVEQRLIKMGAREIEVMVPKDSLDGKKFFEDAGFKDDSRYVFMVKQYPAGT